MGSLLSCHLELNTHQRMFELLNNRSCFLDAIENYQSLSSDSLNTQRSYLAILMKSSFQHILSEAETFFPSDDDRTHILIVLLRAHLLIDLLTKLLPLFVFLHFLIIEILSSLGLGLHVFLRLAFLFFSPLQVLNQGSPLSPHRLNSQFLLLDCLNMISVEFSVGFDLQKLVSSVYFDKLLGCLIIFVAVRMIFQGQRSIVLLQKRKVTSWSIEDLIGVSLQFLNDLFESFHVIRVIIINLIVMSVEWFNGLISNLWAGQQNSSGPVQRQQSESMSQIARLKRLSSLLQNSAYTKTQQQQICMFYSAVISQYPQARATTTYPTFLYEPSVYTTLLSFTIPIKIQTSQIYCELELAIVFHQEIATSMPSFFIKNPDYTLYKPLYKYVKFGKEQKETHKYQAIFGGIKVKLPSVSPQRWQWTSQHYYKQQNVVNIIRFINKILLIDYFPFAKRKTPISTQVIQKSKEVRDFLEQKVILSQRSSDLQEIPLLENIQSASTLSISIQSQINHLKQQIKNMKNTIKSSQHFTLREFFPQTRDKKSLIILESLSSLEACRDVQNELQRQFLKEQLDLNNFKHGLFQISSKKFEAYYRLAQWKSPQLL